MNDWGPDNREALLKETEKGEEWGGWGAQGQGILAPRARSVEGGEKRSRPEPW